MKYQTGIGVNDTLIINTCRKSNKREINDLLQPSIKMMLKDFQHAGSTPAESKALHQALDANNPDGMNKMA
jgi:hypothetical protein